MVVIRFTVHLPNRRVMAGFTDIAGVGVILIEVMTIGASTAHLIVLQQCGLPRRSGLMTDFALIRAYDMRGVFTVCLYAIVAFDAASLKLRVIQLL